MFDEIKIDILEDNPKDGTLKSILADVQEYNGEIDIDNLKVTVYKRLYIDYLEPLMEVNIYLEINDEVLKVVKVNKYSDYMEVFVTEIKDIKINGVDRTVIIEDTSDKIIDYKTIVANFKINTGDLIQYQNENWLIVGEVEQGKNSYKGTMRKAPHLIKMYIDNILQEIPCLIETSAQDIQTGQYFSFGVGKIKLTVQDNNISKKIDENIRFIKMGSAWEIVGHTSENKGLKYFYCEKTQVDSINDNLDLEVADYWKHNVLHNYSMVISEETITIEEGQTKQLVVNITDTIDNNTTNIINPSIIYTSLDNSIATIRNTGLIQGIAEGTTTIKVRFENVEKTINVKVVKPLPITVEYAFKTITLDGVEFVGDSIEMDKGTTKILKVTEVEKKVTQGDNVTTEIISNPTVAYSSNNSNVIIDATGKISAIAEGSSTITIAFENIEKTINVDVIAAVSYSIRSSGSTTDYSYINLGSSRTYKIIDNNGIDVTDKTFIFTLEQSDKNPTILPTQLITKVEVISNSSVKLYANNSNIKGYFILRGICSENGAVTEKEIRIKAIMDM